MDKFIDILLRIGMIVAGLICAILSAVSLMCGALALVARELQNKCEGAGDVDFSDMTLKELIVSALGLSKLINRKPSGGVRKEPAQLEEAE